MYFSEENDFKEQNLTLLLENCLSVSGIQKCAPCPSDEETSRTYPASPYIFVSAAIVESTHLS